MVPLIPTLLRSHSLRSNHNDGIILVPAKLLRLSNKVQVGFTSTEIPALCPFSWYILKALAMLSFCMPQELRGCTQECQAAFIGIVKALANSIFSKMLPSDMPLLTVTARKRIVPLI